MAGIPDWAKSAQPDAVPEWAKGTQAAPVQPQQSPGVGASIDAAVADIPRQAGLNARYVLQGLGNTASLINAPLRVPYNALASRLGLPQADDNLGATLSNKMGLPEPQTTTEKVAGAITSTMAGTGGAMKLAGMLEQAPQYIMQNAPQWLQTARQAGTAMASRPDMQLASAAGAGGAGEYAKESGGGPVAQFLAALAGGLVVPAGLAGVQKGYQGIKTLMDRLNGSPQLNAQIDQAIESAVSQNGMRLEQIPRNVLNQLRQDVRNALKTGRLDEAAAKRLADYRLVGATPTAGNVSLDPVQITRERNLAKMGANTDDTSLQQLAQVRNQNNAKLIEGVNNLGASQGDNVSGAQKVMDALEGKLSARKGMEDALWRGARNTGGRDVQLSPSNFAQRANDLLDEAMVGGKLPADVRSNLNKIATGEIPLTVSVSQQFKTAMAALQRNSSDPAEKYAIGLVRKALDEVPIAPGQGAAANAAFERARTFSRGWRTIVDNTPALKAVSEGVEPDKFVETFITGNGPKANISDLWSLRQQLQKEPEAFMAVRQAIARNLKNKALSGASDEVGVFSQSRFNKALNAIGDRKLGMFFTKQEVAQLKAIGRVASYEQVQPAGSAVNNSNTASNLLGAFVNMIGSRKVPLWGPLVVEPLKKVGMSREAGRAMNVVNSLSMKPEEAAGLPPVLIPLLLGASQ